MFTHILTPASLPCGKMEQKKKYDEKKPNVKEHIIVPKNFYQDELMRRERRLKQRGKRQYYNYLADHQITTTNATTVGHGNTVLTVMVERNDETFTTDMVDALAYMSKDEQQMQPVCLMNNWVSFKRMFFPDKQMKAFKTYRRLLSVYGHDCLHNIHKTVNLNGTSEIPAKMLELGKRIELLKKKEEKGDVFVECKDIKHDKLPFWE